LDENNPVFYNFFKNGYYKNNSNDDLGYLSDSEIYRNTNFQPLKNTKKNVKIRQKKLMKLTKISVIWHFKKVAKIIKTVYFV